MNSIFSKKTKEESTTYDTMSSLSHTKWNCTSKSIFVKLSKMFFTPSQKTSTISKLLLFRFYL